MSKNAEFVFFGSKLILTDEKIIFEKNLLHKFKWLSTRKNPDEILLKDIDQCYIKTDNIRGQLIINHNGVKEEVEINTGIAHKFRSLLFSTEGINGAKRFVKEVNERTKENISKFDRNEDDSVTIMSRNAEEKEYKRTCQSCGEKWHVLAKREKKVKRQKTGSELSQCGAALSCCFILSAVSQSNAQDAEEQLNKMRSCPECGSHNYEEETLTYEK